MSLRTAVLSGVTIANKATKSLQAAVTFERCGAGSDGYGTTDYGSPVVLTATVEGKTQQVVSPSGEVAVSTTTVTFLDVAALLAATPAIGAPDAVPAGLVSVRDKITLPDGRTQKILSVGGFVDAGTGNPFATEVYLG